MTDTIEQLREALKLSEYDDPRPFWDKWKTHATLVVKNAAADHLKHMEGKSLPPDMVCTICETQGDPKCWACVQYGRAKGMTGERTLTVDDGRVFWKHSDGSHRCVTQADADAINRAALASASAAKPEGEKDGLAVEYLSMFDEPKIGTKPLRPTWFIGEAKKRAGRNPAIISETDMVLCAYFLDVIKEEYLKEAKSRPVIPEGYALVPIEPTEAMLDAGYDAGDFHIMHYDGTDKPGTPRYSLRESYKAMIAAAHRDSEAVEEKEVRG